MLAGGQVERQALQQLACRDPSSRRGADGPDSPVRRGAAHQRPLQTRPPRRKSAAPGAAPRSASFSARWMARSASSSEIRLCCGTERFRQRIGDRVEHLEHLPDTRVDVPALQLRAGGVDREEVALEGRLQHLAARPPARRRRSSSATGCPGCVRPAASSTRKSRVGQLHGAPEIADLPGQHHPRALGQLVLDPLLRLKNVAVTLPRPEPRVTRDSLSPGSVSDRSSRAASVISSTRVTCSPSRRLLVVGAANASCPRLYLRG